MIRQMFNRLRYGTTVHGYRAKITFTVASNASSRQEFKDMLVEPMELAKQTLERNDLLVADRDGYEPKVKIL